MPKQGILHDYDLMANQESSANNQQCAVCGESPMTFQWSDYSGEAMCTKCGCPYQLKWGSKEQEAEKKYPYLNMKESFIPVAKEYWTEKKTFVCYGTMLSGQVGMAKLDEWVREKHPELI